MGKQTKVSGLDLTGYRGQAAYKRECWWCWSYCLGPVDLLAPLERCKRGRGMADVSREKLNWAPREVPRRREQPHPELPWPALAALCLALPVGARGTGWTGGAGGKWRCHAGHAVLLYIRPIKLVDDMNGANQNSAAPLQCAALRSPSLPHHAQTWVGCNGCQMRCTKCNLGCPSRPHYLLH